MQANWCPSHTFVLIFLSLCTSSLLILLLHHPNHSSLTFASFYSSHSCVVSAAASSRSLGIPILLSKTQSQSTSFLCSLLTAANKRPVIHQYRYLFFVRMKWKKSFVNRDKMETKGPLLTDTFSSFELCFQRESTRKLSLQRAFSTKSINVWFTLSFCSVCINCTTVASTSKSTISSSHWIACYHC